MKTTLECLKSAWSKIIPGPQRFVEALKGESFLDLETGLVWAKAPISRGSTWFGALEYCAKLSLGGRKGWRLPTIEELSSLVEPKNHQPALPDEHPFSLPQPPPDDPSANIPEYYWSSTTYFVDSENALALHLPSGEIGCQYTKITNNFLIWPVRGGQSHIVQSR